MINQTDQLLLEIRKKDLKLFQLLIRIERSENLEWIILSHKNQEMAIHWAGKNFRLNTIEGYTHTGFIAALETPETVTKCRKIIRAYFRHGYNHIFRNMLSRRSKLPKGNWIAMDQFTREIKRKQTPKKTKSKSLEIPPSLKKIVEEKTSHHL